MVWVPLRTLWLGDVMWEFKLTCIGNFCCLQGYIAAVLWGF